MDILGAALAFAITMLVLSMVVSALVEVIHRIGSMREAGLKYMLEQMFEQVLKKPIEKFKSEVPALAQQSIDEISASFVERMSSNRAPMGVTPKELPVGRSIAPGLSPTTARFDATAGGYWEKAKSFIIKVLQFLHLWNGRDLASMTPSEFMERLGSTDLGTVIKKANDSIGGATAEVVDAVLKDVAQKFEAVGKEASAYFEGRARLLSVAVAVALAFAAHVDAIELFNTFLRNPSVRNNVIAQLDAVTKQYSEMDKKLDNAQKAAAAAKQAPKVEQTPPPSGPATTNDPKPKTPEEQFKDAQQAVKGAVDQAKQTISDLAALGVPIGWTEERSSAAQLKPILWTCPNFPYIYATCTDKKKVWIEAPTVLRVWLSLFIGGMLIGLGGPFWRDAITNLTSIRNVASSFGSSAAAAPSGAGATEGVPKVGKEAQPATPVDVFKVAHQAKIAGDPPSDTSGSSGSKPGASSVSTSGDSSVSTSGANTSGSPASKPNT